MLISFLTWNYFINAMGMTWGHFFGVDFSAEPTAGSGLAMIAGIKTLDTSIIGAIVIWIITRQIVRPVQELN